MIVLPLELENNPELFSLRQKEQRKEIFDPIRKKWVALQPEEWVRQNVIQTLMSKHHVPGNLISIEKGFLINQRQKRFDLVIYDRQVKPAILVECKAFHVPVNQKVFDQLSKYNVHIRAPFLMATNGVVTYCCRQNHENRDLVFINHLPELW